MVGRHHLGEIDDDGATLLVDHDVELVEVAVDDAAIAQAYDEVHQFVVQRLRIGHRCHMRPETQMK